MSTKQKSGVGAPAKYPWAAWLKPKSKHQLVRGTHFTCSTRTMITYLYARANRAGLRVTIHEIAEGVLDVEVRKKVAA